MMDENPTRKLNSNEHVTTPIEVSAAILTKLARDASAQLGYDVQDAVIAVPAHFKDPARSATKAAAEMAGLNVVELVNEPSAAALTYSQGQKAEPGVALVFDLGGGTFDVTVLSLDGSKTDILSTFGAQQLGGLDFTRCLVEYLRDRYKEFTGAPYPKDSISRSLLWELAENAKCQLSEVATVTVRLAPECAQSIDLTVTREEFERQVGILLGDLHSVVKKAVERAEGKVQRSITIERVLLCGGSSRIPAVQKMLENHFGYPPERVLNPDLSVALGAAYYATFYHPTNPIMPKIGLQL